MEISFGDHQRWSTMSTALLTVLLLWVAYTIVRMVEKFVITPMRIKKILSSQGVRGPPSHLFQGNLREIFKLQQAEEEKEMKTGDYNIVSHVMPFHVQCCQAYGKSYLWWFGPEPRLTISDLDIIKQVLTNKNVFIKSQMVLKLLHPIIGKGLVTTNREEWALHRRVVSPAFHQDKLKAMVVAMGKSASSMIDEWGKKVKDGGGHVELEVGEYMTHVTADIIARTAFGSSYEKGKKVFEHQLALVNLLVQRRRLKFASMPGYSLLPTPLNTKINSTQIALSRSLKEIIQSRKDMAKGANDPSYGDDLLGLMINAAMEESSMKGGKVHFGMQPLMDNCKTFFIAGHETTATLLTWAMMLLASHTTWQERAREEVMEVCGHDDRPIDADMLHKLKTLTMILNETLRLFSPIPMQNRQATTDIQLGDLHIPKGVSLFFPRLAIHHDPQLWGADVQEFKPERFVDGVAKASKHPLAFMPFSFGPRFCVGQGFAMEEAKTVLVAVLQQFRFHLSPNYRHLPYDKVTVKPKYGVLVMLEFL